MVVVVIVVSSAFTESNNLITGLEIIFLQSSTPISSRISWVYLRLLRVDRTVLQYLAINSDIASLPHVSVKLFTQTKV